MSHGLASNGQRSSQKTSRHASDAGRVPANSGVYRGFASGEAVAAPGTWDDDDDDQVTAVQLLKSGEFARQTIVPPPPAGLVKRPVWQVAMLLHGHELDRLWARNAASISGRLFVWSQHARAWVPMLAAPEFTPAVARTTAPPIGQRTLRPSESFGAMGSPSSDSIAPVTSHRLGTLAQPIDVTNDVRAETITLTLPQVRWLLAGLAALVALALGSSRMLAGSDKARPNHAIAMLEGSQNLSELHASSNAQLTGAQTARANTAGNAEIIPVESLPLISESNPKPSSSFGVASSRKTEPNSTSGSSHKTQYSQLAHAARPFDSNLARQALAGAIQQARRCARGDLSGSVVVTFDPSGTVKDLSINTLAGDTSQTQCLMSAMRTAKVAPFGGGPVVVRKSFRIGS